MATLPEMFIVKKTEESKTKVTYEIAEPITNADRIRSMSDEKLATKLYLFTCVHVFDSKVKCEDNGCKKCWLDWLKECAE